jgi:hypothetical protein
MTLAERIAAELTRVSTDRFMFGLFGDGRMGSGGFGKLQILGKTKHVTRCQNCGRAGLKHAVVCAVVGEDGQPTNQYYYFGTDCAAKLAGKAEKDVEAEAEHQESSGRPRMKNLKPAKPNEGQMELGLRFSAFWQGMSTERYARAKAAKGQMGFDFDALASAPQSPAPATEPATPMATERQPMATAKGRQMGLFEQPEQPPMATKAATKPTGWDEEKHPRWEAGDKQHHGGQFSPKESKSEERGQEEEKPQAAISNPPFRDFRYVPKHRNSGSLYPNRPGQVFTDEQQQQLRNWARQNGMMVGADSGPGAIHVVHNDHRSRLDLTLHGAEGVKREAAEVKSKQAAEQEVARKQQADSAFSGRASAGFINDAFGDSLNTYNKSKLADVLEGKEKKFGGLWGRSHVEPLQKLGALDATGQVNLDAIKRAFEQHGKAADSPAQPQEEPKAQYFKGDEIRLTGKTDGDFEEFEYLEGHKKGQKGLRLSPAASEAQVKQKQQEWKDQQAQFGRLHQKQEEPKAEGKEPWQMTRAEYRGQQPVWNHQTWEGFDRFDENAARSKFPRAANSPDRLGVWFTDQTGMYGPTNLEAHANVKKPLVFADDENGGATAFAKMQQEIQKAGGPEKYREQLRQQGFDGVSLQNTRTDLQKDGSKRQNMLIALDWNAPSILSRTAEAKEYAQGQAVPSAFDRHRSAVEQAIAAGKSVPAEVLADYPELQKPAPASQPAESVPSAGGSLPAPELQAAQSVGGRVAEAIAKRSMDFGRKVEVRKDRAKKLGPRETAGEAVDPAEQVEGWARRYKIVRIDKSRDKSEEGKYAIYDARTKSRYGGMGHKQATQRLFESEEEAKAALPLLEVARNHDVAKSRDGTTYEIRRKFDRHAATVKGGFASREDAARHMAMNPREIINHKFPSYETYQYLDRVERKGPDRRSGNVNEQDFQKAFVPGGAVFGNWMTNKDGVTAFHHAYDSLHDLADVLAIDPQQVSLDGDLVYGFGAAGSGGKNAARAHYEPGQRLINLTKMAGAGSLAHEWWHALDHFMAKHHQLSDHTAIGSHSYKMKGDAGLKQAIKDLEHALHNTSEDRVIEAHDKAQDEKDEKRKVYRADLRQKSIENKTEIPYAESVSDHLHNLRVRRDSLIGWKKKTPTPELLKQYDELEQKIANGDYGDEVHIPGKGRWSIGTRTYANIKALDDAHKKMTGRSFLAGDSTSYSPGKELYTQISVDNAFAKEKAERAAKAGQTEKVSRSSTFSREAAELDRTRASRYYTLPEEMGARAFEAYIADKLDEKGVRSDYLIGRGKTDNAIYRAVGLPGPFPEGEERKQINAAFDKLLNEVRKHLRKPETERHSLADDARELGQRVRRIVERYSAGQPSMQGELLDSAMVESAKKAGASKRSIQHIKDHERQKGHPTPLHAIRDWYERSEFGDMSLVRVKQLNSEGHHLVQFKDHATGKTHEQVALTYADPAGGFSIHDEFGDPESVFRNGKWQDLSFDEHHGQELALLPSIRRPEIVDGEYRSPTANQTDLLGEPAKQAPKPKAVFDSSKGKQHPSFVRKVTDTSNPEHDNQNLGSAAWTQDGHLNAIHVTNNHAGALKALQAGDVTSHNKDAHEDLGAGLYASAVPHYWRGRATNRWDFLPKLKTEQVHRLADHAIGQLQQAVKSGYNSESEANPRIRELHDLKAGKLPPAALQWVADQPYNIDLANPLLLKEHGIDPGQQPEEVHVKAQGKFAELNRQISHDERKQLEGLGFHGAYITGGMHGSPQVVIWDHNAIKKFGNYEHKPQPKPATNLFGEPAKSAPKPKAVFDSSKGKQQTLFAGLNAKEGQMNLFADAGVPDDLVAKPQQPAQKELFSAIREALVERYEQAGDRQPKFRIDAGMKAAAQPTPPSTKPPAIFGAIGGLASKAGNWLQDKADKVAGKIGGAAQKLDQKGQAAMAKVGLADKAAAPAKPKSAGVKAGAPLMFNGDHSINNGQASIPKGTQGKLVGPHQDPKNVVVDVGGQHHVVPKSLLLHDLRHTDHKAVEKSQQESQQAQAEQQAKVRQMTARQRAEAVPEGADKAKLKNMNIGSHELQVGDVVNHSTPGLHPYGRVLEVSPDGKKIKIEEAARSKKAPGGIATTGRHVWIDGHEKIGDTGAVGTRAFPVLRTPDEYRPIGERKEYKEAYEGAKKLGLNDDQSHEMAMQMWDDLQAKNNPKPKPAPAAQQPAQAQAKPAQAKPAGAPKPRHHAESLQSGDTLRMLKGTDTGTNLKFIGRGKQPGMVEVEHPTLGKQTFRSRDLGLYVPGSPKAAGPSFNDQMKKGYDRSAPELHTVKRSEFAGQKHGVLAKDQQGRGFLLYGGKKYALSPNEFDGKKLIGDNPGVKIRERIHREQIQTLATKEPAAVPSHVREEYDHHWNKWTGDSPFAKSGGEPAKGPAQVPQEPKRAATLKGMPLNTPVGNAGVGRLTPVEQRSPLEDAALREQIEERAAIMEHEGGYDPQSALRLAIRDAARRFKPSQPLPQVSADAQPARADSRIKPGQKAANPARLEGQKAALNRSLLEDAEQAQQPKAIFLGRDQFRNALQAPPSRVRTGTPAQPPAPIDEEAAERAAIQAEGNQTTPGGQAASPPPTQPDRAASAPPGDNSQAAKPQSPNLRALIRPFQAGRNVAAIQFHDELQRDLHDYAAAQGRRRQFSGNASRRQPQQAAQLESKLKQIADQHFGGDKDAAHLAALQTLGHVKAHMKGAQDGEHRVIPPTGQAPAGAAVPKPEAATGTNTGRLTKLPQNPTPRQAEQHVSTMVNRHLREFAAREASHTQRLVNAWKSYRELMGIPSDRRFKGSRDLRQALAAGADSEGAGLKNFDVWADQLHKDFPWAFSEQDGSKNESAIFDFFASDPPAVLKASDPELQDKFWATVTPEYKKHLEMMRMGEVPLEHLDLIQQMGDDMRDFESHRRANDNFSAFPDALVERFSVFWQSSGGMNGRQAGKQRNPSLII